MLLNFFSCGDFETMAPQVNHQPCPLHPPHHSHYLGGGAGDNGPSGGNAQTLHIRSTGGLQLSEWSHVTAAASPANGHKAGKNGHAAGPAVALAGKVGATRTLGSTKFNLNRKKDLMDERDFSLDTEKPYF